MRFIAIASALASVATGCSQPIDTSRHLTSNQNVQPRALPPVSEAAQQGRGTLLDATTFTDIDPAIAATGATAFRIEYQSTSGVDGSPVLVSGSVFEPAGSAPEGGWNVVSVGHGTTGISPECGPSLYPDLIGYSEPLASLLELGVVVVMTDYQGLGVADGQHRFLEPHSSGYNIIDAVRAARSLIPDTSLKWAAFGVSQGGQAAWSAAELADYYGSGLDFVGSVALAPAVNLVHMAELSETNWLTRDQQILMPFLMSGFHAAYPDVKYDDYLHGVLASNLPMWLSCTGTLAEQRARSIDTINPGDTAPNSAEATQEFKDWLIDIALPQRPASGPILVVNGGEDAVIRPSGIENAIAAACKYGDAIKHIVRPTQTHYNLDPGGDTATWLVQRFAGEPAPSDC